MTAGGERWWQQMTDSKPNFTLDNLHKESDCRGRVIFEIRLSEAMPCHSEWHPKGVQTWRYLTISQPSAFVKVQNVVTQCLWAFIPNSWRLKDFPFFEGSCSCSSTIGTCGTGLDILDGRCLPSRIRTTKICNPANPLWFRLFFQIGLLFYFFISLNHVKHLGLQFAVAPMQCLQFASLFLWCSFGLLFRPAGISYLVHALSCMATTNVTSPCQRFFLHVYEVSDCGNSKLTSLPVNLL